MTSQYPVMRGKKVVITGGAGFIGSSIADRLADENEVVVFDDLSTGLAGNIPSKAKFARGSCVNKTQLDLAMKGADYVFHQAALPSVPRSTQDPKRSFDNNCLAITQALLAARDNKVKTFVFAGSSSAYGDAKEDYKVETLPTNPKSLYASYKVLGEHMCKNFHDLFGLNTVVLRYFNVFGPKQRPDSAYAAVIPKFAKLMLQGQQPTIYGDGHTSRDFTYIDNVVNANILAAQVEDPQAFGQVYNVALGDNISLNQLVDKINAYLGTDIKADYAEERQGDVKHSRADIKKAQQILSYEPAITFDEGLAKTIDALRE